MLKDTNDNASKKRKKAKPEYCVIKGKVKAEIVECEIDCHGKGATNG